MEGAAGDAGGGRRRAAAAEAHASEASPTMRETSRSRGLGAGGDSGPGGTSGDAGTSARGLDESEGETLLPPTLRPAQLPRGPAWGMVLNMALYMATPMSMPATMKASGWGWGAFLIAYGGVATFHSGLLLGDIVGTLPHLHTYPDLGEHFGRQLGLRLRGARSPAGAQRWGAAGRRLCLVLQFMAYYLDATAQLLYVVQYLDQLNIPWAGRMCLSDWYAWVFLASLPLQLVPNMAEARWVAVPIGAALFLTVATFFAEVLGGAPWACEPGPSFPRPGAPSIFLSLSAWAYSFGGHGMFVEIMHELREPEKQWKRCLTWTYGLVVPVHAACAFLGYAAYGAYAQANVNLNFPNNAVNRLSIVMQLCLCYYLAFFTNLSTLYGQVEGGLGVGRGVSGPRAAVWRFLIRAAFLGSQVVLGRLLLVNEGDVLLGLQSLSGAIGMTWFTYIAPFAFHWMLQEGKGLGGPMRVWYSMNILFGALTMLGGLASSSTDLLDAMGGGLGRSCNINYRYSPSSPLDPCHLSGYPEG